MGGVRRSKQRVPGEASIKEKRKVSKASASSKFLKVWLKKKKKETWSSLSL